MSAPSVQTLNYHHLRYFREVAREGHLTRAAERLRISQSALSSQVRQLEERLGHALFERIGRRLVLTEAGRVALDHADVIFAAGEELVATLGRGGDDAGSGPPLRVGALATLSRNFMVSLLRPVLASGVRVELRSGTALELIERLDALALDAIVLNGPPPGEPDGRVSHRLAEQGASLIGTPELIGDETNVEPLLRGSPLVVPTVSSGIRVGLDALLARLAIRPTVVAEADDMAMLRLLAREGAGLAVIPAVVVRDELASGALREAAPLPGISETFYAVTRERRFPNPATALLLESAGA